MVFCGPIFWSIVEQADGQYFPAASISILKMRESSRCHGVVALPSEESFWPIARRICSEFQTLWYTKYSGRVIRVWRLTRFVIMFQSARILLPLFVPETRLSILALCQMNWPPSLARLRLRPAVAESTWKNKVLTFPCNIWTVSKKLPAGASIVWRPWERPG